MSIDIRVGSYDGNITSNASRIFNEAFNTNGYWTDLLNGNSSSDVVPIVKQALINLCEKPSHYKQFDSPNGWGIWRDFLPFLAELHEGMINNPNDIIEVM